jgi:hypothetical protein
MGNMPIILDTCAFRGIGFIKRLKSFHGRKIISVVTYSEMQIHLMYKKGKKLTYFDDLLKLVKTNFRDYLIASHAFLPPWLVITHNLKDFEYLEGRIKRNKIKTHLSVQEEFNNKLVI